jgi:hypothetical protein
MIHYFRFGFEAAINGYDLFIPMELGVFEYYDLVAGYAAGINYRNKPNWMLR